MFAETLERRTKRAGRRNGDLGAVGLTILRAMLFSFCRKADGLCCPSYDALQAKTGLCRQSIARGLARLADAGIIKIVRRLRRMNVDFGGFTRACAVQGSNLYSFVAPSLPASLNPPIGINKKRFAGVELGVRLVKGGIGGMRMPSFGERRHVCVVN